MNDTVRDLPRKGSRRDVHWKKKKRKIRIAARILVSTTVQGGVDMQQIHPRPPSHRRRWLHCGFPVKSSRIRHRCSSLICVTSGPAYSHIWRVHIWLMCIWRHKCHSSWTTCSSVGPAKEFRIHWSFSSPPWPHHPPSPVLIHPTSLSPDPHPTIVRFIPEDGLSWK